MTETLGRNKLEELLKSAEGFTSMKDKTEEKIKRYEGRFPAKSDKNGDLDDYDPYPGYEYKPGEDDETPPSRPDASDKEFVNHTTGVTIPEDEQQLKLSPAQERIVRHYNMQQQASDLISEGEDVNDFLEIQDMLGDWTEDDYAAFQERYEYLTDLYNKYQGINDLAAEVIVEDLDYSKIAKEKVESGEWLPEDEMIFYSTRAQLLDNEDTRKQIEEQAIIKEYVKSLEQNTKGAYYSLDFLMAVRNATSEIAAKGATIFDALGLDFIGDTELADALYEQRDLRSAAITAFNEKRFESGDSVARHVRGITNSLFKMYTLRALGMGEAGIIAGFAADQGSQARYEADKAGLKPVDKWAYVTRSAAIEAVVASAFSAANRGGIEKVIGNLGRGTGLTGASLKQILRLTGKNVIEEVIEENMTEIAHLWNQRYANLIGTEQFTTEMFIQTIKDTTLQTVGSVGIAESMNIGGTVANNIDLKKNLMENHNLDEEAAKRVMQAGFKASQKGNDFTMAAGRQIEIEEMKTRQGALGWLADHMGQAQWLISNPQPSRSDFKKVGLPELNKAERAQFVRYIRPKVEEYNKKVRELIIQERKRQELLRELELEAEAQVMEDEIIARLQEEEAPVIEDKQAIEEGAQFDKDIQPLYDLADNAPEGMEEVLGRIVTKYVTSEDIENKDTQKILDALPKIRQEMGLEPDPEKSTKQNKSNLRRLAKKFGMKPMKGLTLPAMQKRFVEFWNIKEKPVGVTQEEIEAAVPVMAEPTAEEAAQMEAEEAAAVRGETIARFKKELMEDGSYRGEDVEYYIDTSETGNIVVVRHDPTKTQAGDFKGDIVASAETAEEAINQAAQQVYPEPEAEVRAEEGETPAQILKRFQRSGLPQTDMELDSWLTNQGYDQATAAAVFKVLQAGVKKPKSLKKKKKGEKLPDAKTQVIGQLKRPGKGVIEKVSSTPQEMIDMLKSHGATEDAIQQAMRPDVLRTPDGKDPVTGAPITIELFRGTGRDPGKQIYSKGIEGPILGEGKYWAINRAEASIFGPNVESDTITLENPFVIVSPQDIIDMMDGQLLPMEAEAMNVYYKELSKRIRAAGHDGVIVNVPQGSDSNAEGKSIKRIREAFGITQVVQFPKVEAKPKSLKKKKTDIESMSTDELDALIEEKYKQNAPQSEIDALETEFAKRVTPEEKGVVDDMEDDEVQLEVDVADIVAQAYDDFLNSDVWEKKDFIGNIRATIEGKGGDTKGFTDDQIFDAAKDAWEARQERKERIKKGKGKVDAGKPIEPKTLKKTDFEKASDANYEFMEDNVFRGNEEPFMAMRGMTIPQLKKLIKRLKAGEVDLNEEQQKNIGEYIEDAERELEDHENTIKITNWEPKTRPEDARLLNQQEAIEKGIPLSEVPSGKQEISLVFPKTHDARVNIKFFQGVDNMWRAGTDFMIGTSGHSSPVNYLVDPHQTKEEAILTELKPLEMIGYRMLVEAEIEGKKSLAKEKKFISVIQQAIKDQGGEIVDEAEARQAVTERAEQRRIRDEEFEREAVIEQKLEQGEEIKAVLEEYEEGEGGVETVSDLASKIGDIIRYTDDPYNLKEAIETLYDEQLDDGEMGKRGDSDAYEQAFLDKIYDAVSEFEVFEQEQAEAEEVAQQELIDEPEEEPVEEPKKPESKKKKPKAADFPAEWAEERALRWEIQDDAIVEFEKAELTANAEQGLPPRIDKNGKFEESVMNEVNLLPSQFKGKVQILAVRGLADGGWRSGYRIDLPESQYSFLPSYEMTGYDNPKDAAYFQYDAIISRLAGIDSDKKSVKQKIEQMIAIVKEKKAILEDEIGGNPKTRGIKTDEQGTPKAEKGSLKDMQKRLKDLGFDTAEAGLRNLIFELAQEAEPDMFGGEGKETKEVMGVLPPDSFSDEVSELLAMRDRLTELGLNKEAAEITNYLKEMEKTTQGDLFPGPMFEQEQKKEPTPREQEAEKLTEKAEKVKKKLRKQTPLIDAITKTLGTYIHIKSARDAGMDLMKYREADIGKYRKLFRTNEGGSPDDIAMQLDTATDIVFDIGDRTDVQALEDALDAEFGLKTTEDSLVITEDITSKQFDDLYNAHLAKMSEETGFEGERDEMMGGEDASIYFYSGEEEYTGAQTDKFSNETNDQIFGMPDLMELLLNNQADLPRIVKTFRKPGTSGQFRRDKGIISLRADIFIGPIINTGLIKESDIADVMPLLKGHIFDAFPNLTEDDIEIKIERDQKTGLMRITFYRKDPNFARKVMAHEIGHWADWLPNNLMTRGNILGHIAKLNHYLKEMIGGTPATEHDLLTKKDRAEIRKQAQKAVGKRPNKKKDPDAYKQWSEAVSEEYDRLLDKEADRRGLIRKKEIMNELKALTHWWKPFDAKQDPKYTKYRYSATELYADAISVLFNNPAALKHKARKFYDSFFAYLDRNPDVKVAYDAISEQIRQGVSGSRTRQRVRDGMIEGDEIKAKALETEEATAKDIWEAHGTFMFDTFYHQEKLAKKGKKGLSKITGAMNQIDYARYSGAQIQEYSDEVNREVASFLMENNLTDVDFGEYLLYMRAINERSQMANPYVGDRAGAIQALEAMREEMGEAAMRKLEDARQRYRAIREEMILTPIMEAGVYDQEFSKLLLDNEYYTKFEVKKFIESKYGTQRGIHIYRQIGTLQGVTNTFAATMETDISLMRSLAWNQAKDAVVTELLALGDPNEIRPAEKTQKGRYKVIKDTTEKGWGTIIYMKDGKLVGYDVKASTANAFNRAVDEDFHLVTNLLRKFANPGRFWFTVARPGFQLFNVFYRDPLRTVKNIKGLGVKPHELYYNLVKSLYTGVKEVIPKNMKTGKFLSSIGISNIPFEDILSAIGIEGIGDVDPVLSEMRKRNLLVTWSNLGGMDDADTQAERVLNRYRNQEEFDNKIKNPLKRWFARFLLAGNIGEVANKRAGYVYLKKNQQRLGYTDEQIDHMVRHWVGSPSFLTGGRATPITNSLFLFSNAMFQGWRSDIEAFKTDPLSVGAKTVAYSIMPKVIMFGIASGALSAILRALGSDEDDPVLQWAEAQRKVYERASSYDMTNYTVIPFGLDANGKGVYLRIPQDETGRAVGGLFWKMLAGDGQAPRIQDALRYMGDQGAGINPVLEAGKVTYEYLTGRNPYDAFRERKAIREETFIAGGAEAHKAFGKWLWNNYGGSFLYKFRYKNPEETKTQLENFLDFPGMGDIFGRFVKVTDYGLTEKDKKAAEKEFAVAERERQEIRKLVTKKVEGEKLDADEEMMVKESRFAKRYEKSLKVRGGAQVQRRLTRARTNKEKRAILLRMLNTDKDNPGVQAAVDEFVGRQAYVAGSSKLKPGDWNKWKETREEFDRRVEFRNKEIKDALELLKGFDLDKDRIQEYIKSEYKITYKRHRTSLKLTPYGIRWRNIEKILNFAKK